MTRSELTSEFLFTQPGLPGRLFRLGRLQRIPSQIGRRRFLLAPSRSLFQTLLTRKPIRIRAPRQDSSFPQLGGLGDISRIVEMRTSMYLRLVVYLTIGS